MNVLFFVQPGTNSRSTLLDLKAGFERAGHRVFHWDLGPLWQATAREPDRRTRTIGDFTAVTRAFLEHNGIDLSVAMWANGPMSLMSVPVNGGVGSIFDLLDRPHLCYWLDAPQWAHDGQMVGLLTGAGAPVFRSPRLHHAINNAATGREMERVLGLRNVLPQHYGIDERVFRPHADQAKTYDIVFSLGPGDPLPTPLMLEQLGAEDPDVEAIRSETAERLLPGLLRLAARFPEPLRAEAGPELLRALLRTQLADRHTPVLDRLDALAAREPGFAPAARALLADPRLWVDASMLVRTVESWERAFTLAYLSRHFRCAVYGAGGAELGAWGCRAEALGHVAWEDQAKVYSRGRLGLNVMRWQDDAGLNVKPYEITASGAALLCAHRAGLPDLFEPGREVASFRTPREAREAARALLDSPARLAGMAEAGRERTLREYTWTAVARDLVAGIGLKA